MTAKGHAKEVHAPESELEDQPKEASSLSIGHDADLHRGELLMTFTELKEQVLKERPDLKSTSLQGIFDELRVNEDRRRKIDDSKEDDWKWTPAEEQEIMAAASVEFRKLYHGILENARQKR